MPHVGVLPALALLLALLSVPGAPAGIAVHPAAAAVAPGCDQPAPIAAGTSVDTAIPMDPAVALGETRRSYRVHVPAGYQADRAIPVVLAFHGYGGTNADMESYTGFSTLADRDGFIAVYPQGISGYDGQPSWASVGRGDYGVDDVRFVSEMLDALERDLCVDTTRIFATGFSRGGAMVGRLACRLSDRIAAFAPVSGNFYEPDEGCHPHRPLPIIEIHGTADSIVSYYGVPEYIDPKWPLPSVPQWLRGWAARNGCMPEPAIFRAGDRVTGMTWTDCIDGGTVIHYRIEGGEHNWPVGIGDRSIAALLWDFFQSHPLAITASGCGFTAESRARCG